MDAMKQGSAAINKVSFGLGLLSILYLTRYTPLSASGAEDNDEDEDGSVIKFYGKKKSSKKKNNSVLEALDELKDLNQTEQPVIDTSDNEADKNNKEKNKKKKSGRTAQEEDDLDKILAELGEGPSTSKPAPITAQAPQPEEKVLMKSQLDANTDAANEKEVEGGPETAAAKKKKKKKEKGKEKKSAAPAATEVKKETKNETKGKKTDKKVPKHVRDMQERLVRLNKEKERKNQDGKDGGMSKI